MSTGDGYYQHGKCCCCKFNCEPQTFGPLPKQPQSSEHIKQLSEAISRVFETGNSEILPTSPQPRDWVGLTCEQKVNLREENDWYNFPNDLIEATEAKCKQLNTKG